MQNFVKIGHTRYEISRFFSIFTMATVRILDFQIFIFLVADRVETTNVHRHTNFFEIGKTVAAISLLTI